MDTHIHTSPEAVVLAQLCISVSLSQHSPFLLPASLSSQQRERRWVNEGGRKGKETGGQVEEMGDRDSEVGWLNENGKRMEDNWGTHCIYKYNCKRRPVYTVVMLLHRRLLNIYIEPLFKVSALSPQQISITIFQGSSALVTLRFLHR